MTSRFGPRLKAAAYLAKRLVLRGERQRRAPAGAAGVFADAPAEQGRLDVVKDGVVHGWLVDIEHPSIRTAADVYLDGRFVGRAWCDQARPDLEAAGIPVARGFAFQLPDLLAGMGGEITAYGSASGLALGGGPLIVEPRGARSRASASERVLHDDALHWAGEQMSALRAAVTLADQARAYGRRYEVLTELDPDYGDTGWPMTRMLSHHLARWSEGSGAPHGSRQYLALFLAAARRYREAAAGLPVSSEQARRLSAATTPWADGTAHGTLMLDAWRGDEPPPRDAAAAAAALTGFVEEVLLALRLPLELLGGENIRFLSSPAPSGEPCFLEALAARPSAAGLAGGGLSDVQRRAAVRAGAEALGFGPLLGTSGGEAVDRDAAVPRTGSEEIALISFDYGTSGLSANARRSAEALAMAGFSVEAVAVPVEEGRPGRPARPPRTGRPATALVHAQPDDLVEVLLHQPWCVSADRLIGFFMWETEQAPAAFKLGLRLVDEVWTGSRYCARAFEAARAGVPVHVVGHAASLGPSDADFDARDWAGVPRDAFLFYFHFDARSWITRKNPVAAVRAFRQAFPAERNDVRLLIKTRDAALGELPQWSAWWEELREEAAADPRVILRDDDLTGPQMVSLLTACDAFVSLHRSEGFGYGMAEAMLAGKPVIASAYSGNLDFMDDQSALLVPARRRPVRRGEFLWDDCGQVWGEPDVPAAAEQMRRVAEGGHEALAARGRARAADACSIERLADVYGVRLRSAIDASPR